MASPARVRAAKTLPAEHHARMSADDRRHQLIEVAIDLFSRNGFRGTTTKQIATAAGITEALIFRHFATKRDLYNAILDYVEHSRSEPRWLQEAKTCCENRDDEGLFRLIARNVIRAYRMNPKVERLMLYAVLEGHELVSIHHSRVAAPFAMLRTYVESRQREGALRGTNPNAVIIAAAGMAMQYGMGTMLESAGEFFNFDDEEAIDTFTGILMNGARVEPAAKKPTKRRK